MTALQKEIPAESGIGKLLESARKEQADQRQRDGLTQARSLLAARHYDDSIALMSKLQADFPGEPEIVRLLTTAREDLAEQQKELKLADARSLLAARSFSEALTVLNSLACLSEGFSGSQTSRAGATRTGNAHERAKLQRELDALKKLMGENKYSEVIAQGGVAFLRVPLRT